MYKPKKQPTEVRDKDGKLIRVLPPVAACRTWTLGDKQWNIRRWVTKEEMDAAGGKEVVVVGEKGEEGK